MLALIGFYVLLVIYFFACLFLIMVILAQEGKGGGLSGLGGATAIGEAFGFGAASGALRKWTRNAAITFILLTIVLTFWGEYIARSRAERFLNAAESVPAATGVPAGGQPVAQEGGTPAGPISAQPAGGAPAAPVTGQPAGGTAPRAAQQGQPPVAPPATSE
jgi:preprotein translocase subunit SecG